MRRKETKRERDGKMVCMSLYKLIDRREERCDDLISFL
jgi:hypothetical protein